MSGNKEKHINAVNLLARKQKSAIFRQLRQQIYSAQNADSQIYPLQIESLDRALSGGLASQHVHLITGLPSDASPTGFVLAMLRQMMDQADKTDSQKRPVIWCAPPFGGIRGNICPEGMLGLGLDVSRFIFVHEPNPGRLMGAFEEALQTKGVIAIVAEYGMLATKTAQWQRWAQRLRRAARAGTATGFLLGQSAPASSFETGWTLTARSLQQVAEIKGSPKPPSQYIPGQYVPSQYVHAQHLHDWRPCWSVCLDHARTGYPCKADVIYDPVSGQLSPVLLHRQPAEDETAAWAASARTGHPHQQAG